MTAPRTIGDALADARRALAEFESPESDALELVSRLLGIGRGEVAARVRDAMSDVRQATLDRWLERRVAGEPVQYITGRAAFRDLDLFVTPAVLIPRPETEELAGAVLDALHARADAWPAPRVVDLGTGSGAIALAIASEAPQSIVTATDASAAALEIAKQNARALGLFDRIRFAEGHWFDALDPDEKFEAVVSNPPYIAETERASLPRDVRDHEPAAALFAGETGLDAIREIVDLAPDALVAGGLLALELAENRAEEVAAWLDGTRDWEHVELRDDLAGRPRFLLATRQRGPAIAPRQWAEEG